MRYLAAAACLLAVLPPRASPPSYLFVWAGDSAGASSDFLGVIDATPSSPTYGRIIASFPTGTAGSHPHHTELEMPASGHLLANGFHAGRTWLFDLTVPRSPKLLTSFADLAGFSHPHSFVRREDGSVLATFQYRAGTTGEAQTGGLVHMDERGTVLRAASAADTRIADRRLYPYSVLPIPALDVAVSTTTDMNPANRQATSEWVQFWRLSDLTLRRSLALPPGPRGDEHRFSGEPRLLADGRSVYIHTFNCGLYLLRDVDAPAPTATFVHGFDGGDCGVPVLAGRFWIQTVPKIRSLVVLDLADPAAPRAVQTLSIGDDEDPHWLAIDLSGTRLVLNSSGAGTGNRLMVLDFDRDTGRLAFDERFRDPGSARPGIRLTGKPWPHGFAGTAVPHGAVFSR